MRDRKNYLFYGTCILIGYKLLTLSPDLLRYSMK